jgi:two-component system, OmpR family, phosphate regulon sensor histidine kinase PhoR
MKKKRIIFIIVASALSLLGLVVLQISWIRHAMELRESQLRHRLTLASYRISHKLSKDSSLILGLKNILVENQSKKMATQVENRMTISLNENQRAKVDSLLMAEFRFHQVELKYNFRFLDKNHKNYAKNCFDLKNSKNTHGICLDKFFKPKKVELQVVFLNPNAYIFAQMGWMLLGSVLLIGLVILCLSMTIYTIWQQKKMSEMTADFINNMTHELKTPISTIALASNMLRKNKIANNTEKITHFSDIIYQENQKLQLQVEQVLRIAKLERGDFQLQKVEANINQIIQNAIATLDLQVTSKGGKILCSLQAIKTNIKADITHLTNVVSNLLDNANKYSPKNPEIRISTRNREDGIIIAIEDKGIGMSKDKQKHIFEKFYRVATGNVHDVKGFGLGLAYVKLMVDAHKGYIALDSELGKGSKFEVFLPFQ